MSLVLAVQVSLAGKRERTAIEVNEEEEEDEEEEEEEEATRMTKMPIKEKRRYVGGLRKRIKGDEN